MRDGWIKIQRDIQDNDLWLSEKFSRGQAWMDLIMLANYKEGYIRIAGEKIEIKRGQCGWSIMRLAERWKWSRKKVQNFLNELEKEHQIEQQKNSRTTIITITNYENFQDKRTSELATEEHQTAQQKNNRLPTNKENKEKKENKEILVSSSSVASEKIFENLVLAQATKGENEQNKQALATQRPETKNKDKALTTQSPDKGDNTAKNQNQTSEIIKFSDQAKTGNLATQTQKDQNKNTPPVPPTPPNQFPSPKIAQSILDFLDKRAVFMSITHIEYLRDWEKEHGEPNVLLALKEAELKFKLRDFRYIAGILRIQQERGYPWDSEQQTKPIIKPMQAKQANYSEDDSEDSYSEQNYSKQAIKPRYNKQAGNSEVSASVQIIAMQKMEETRQKIMFDLMDFKGMGLPYEKQKSEIWKRYRVDLDTAQIY